MDSQKAHSHMHNEEQDTHFARQHQEGEEEHHHEKKSVLTKVKARAKKIKDTFITHGQGHNHDHDHEGPVPDDHDLDEDDDEDEGIVEDPEIHGGPLDASAKLRSSVPGEEENLGKPAGDYGRTTAVPGVPGEEENKGQPRVNLGRKTVMEEEPRAPENTPASFSPGIYQAKDTDSSRTLVPGQEEHPGQPKVNLERPTGLEEEDPYSTSSKYQTKVADPTGQGGEKAGITPILHSFDKMNIYDESGPKPKSTPEQSLQDKTRDHLPNLSTGSNDQSVPEICPPKPITISEKPQPTPEASDVADKPSNQSSYTEIISSATYAIAGKAATAKNVVASKLGYGDKERTAEHEMQGGGEKPKSASAEENGKKTDTTGKEKLGSVYGKVSRAGSTVISKIHGTNTGPGNEQETGVKGQGRGVSVKDYYAEKLRPGDEDRALSEVITDALHKRKEEPKEESRPKGKVTESEEVARRLGSEDEKCGEKVDSPIVNSPGKGVVDKIKGTVGSWFGQGGESPGSQQSINSPHGNEQFSSSASEEVGHSSGIAGERRLQDSGK